MKNVNKLEITLNKRELETLKLLNEQVIECTGNEFGYIEDTSRGNFSKNEFAGYVGQLVLKGMITQPDSDFNGQFEITETGKQILGDNK